MTFTFQKVVVVKSSTDQENDFEFWTSKSFSERIDALAFHRKSIH
jgi:hypothetical protein